MKCLSVCNEQIKIKAEDCCKYMFKLCLTSIDNNEMQEALTSEFTVNSEPELRGCDVLDKEDVVCDIPTNMNKKTDAQSAHNTAVDVETLHVTSSVTKVPSYTCQFCDQVFLIKPYLTLHLKIHQHEVEENKRILKNQVCEQKADRERSLLFFKQLDLIFQTQSCTQCEKQFERLIDLNKHISDEHKEVILFQCSYCSKSFTSKNSLEMHVDKFHIDVRPFKCDPCDKRFKSRHGLYNHSLFLCSSDIQPYKCQECDKTFLIKSLMRQHIRKVHKKYYDCTMCGKKYKYKCDLKKHINISHSNIKPFECPICNKMFKLRGLVTSHMNMHNAELNFNCEYCTKKFKAKFDLNRHLKTHSSLRPFLCSMCSKTFKTKRTLVSHMLVHTSLRPFHCDICGESFKCKSALTAHGRTHSNLNNFKCGHCKKIYKTKSKLKKHNKVCTAHSLSVLIKEHSYSILSIEPCSVKVVKI